MNLSHFYQYYHFRSMFPIFVQHQVKYTYWVFYAMHIDVRLTTFLTFLASNIDQPRLKKVLLICKVGNLLYVHGNELSLVSTKSSYTITKVVE